MKTILPMVILLIANSLGFSQGAFVTSWKTDNPGPTENNQIQIPTSIFYTYDYTVDWGDGHTDTNVTGDITHTYDSPGTYTVSIQGVFPAIRFQLGSDREKLLTIEQWGDINWRTFDGAFSGCVNLTIPAADVPDLSLVTDLSQMFASATSVNQSIDHWDVSTITNMSEMFRSALEFNRPLNSWDVSNVTDMSSMFQFATSFNQPLDSWDVSKVTNMNSLFASSEFNQPIGNWDVGNVTDMERMFGDTPFDQPLSDWNVSNVSIMSGLFSSTSFNHPIDNWDVSSVTQIDAIFFSNTVFNQPLNSWNTSNVTNMGSAFHNAESFDQLLDSWNTSSVTDMRQMFNGASDFNQSINDWDMSSVTNTNSMFSGASAFNQPLNEWNVSNVTNMGGMFSGAVAFNQPLSFWDVSNVTDMGVMFFGATAFDQPLGDWDVSNVTSMGFMLSSSGLSSTNYDNTLIGWSSLPSLQSAVEVGAQGLEFCNATEQRQLLIDTYSWNFIFDEQVCFDGVDNYFFRIDENSPQGTFLGQLMITSRNNEAVDLSILSGNTSDAFLIDPTTQEIFVQNQSVMNFEAPSFSIVLNATAGAFSETVTVGVSFNDINEPPFISDGFANIEEYSPTGTVAREVFVSDPERDEISFEISGGNTDNAFAVNDDGELIVENVLALNHSVNPIFTIEITVSDGEFESQGTITINLINEPGKLPEELARGGAVSFTIGDNHYFGLGQRSGTAFSDFYQLDLTTRALVELPDYPGAGRSESVVLVIQDKAYVGSGINEEGTVFSDFYAFDPSANSWSPIADLPGEARRSAVAFVLEGAGYVGTGFGESDELSDFWRYRPDEDSWEEIEGFTGSKRQEAAAFVIENKAYVTGGFLFDDFSEQLSDIHVFDAATSSWSEAIFADIDLGFQGATAVALKGSGFILYGNRGNVTSYEPVSGRVDDLGDLFFIDNDEIGPVRNDAVNWVDEDRVWLAFGTSGFSPTEYNSSLLGRTIQNVPPSRLELSGTELLENVNNFNIGTLSTTDGDAQDSHAYTLVEGNGVNDADNNLFRVVRDISEVLLFNIEPLDFEERPDYNVYLRSTDRFGEFIEEAFTISVLDANDSPVINNTSLTFTIAEGGNENTVVGTVLASDQDGDDLDYAILSGNTDEAFAFRGNQLVISNVSAVDFETNENFGLAISVSDGEATITEQVIVNVTNVNEPPIFSNSVFTILENPVVGEFIATPFASDPEGEAVVVSILEGNEDEIFTLDPERGAVFANKVEAFDFESTEVITILYSATDGVLTSQHELTVSILNVNEHPVVTTTSFTLEENPDSGSIIGSLGASDPENDPISYILTSAPVDAFSIDESGNLFLTNTDNLEQRSTTYELVVEVSDGLLSNSYLISIDQTVTLNIESTLIKPRIYPNPSANYLVVEVNKGFLHYQIRITDSTGKSVYETANQSTIDVSTLPSGIYFLQIETEDQSYQSRFIKR